jgi:transcriptional regulator with XRE-family HTH domain
MKIGHNIRQFREVAGFSQAQMATLIGVSRNAVSQWESDTTRPSTAHLMKVAKILGVSITQIMVSGAAVKERVILDAIRLFSRLGYEVTTEAVICAASDVTMSEFSSLFSSKDDLLYEIAKVLLDNKRASIRKPLPNCGSLNARLKYLVRMLFVCDVEHLKLTIAMQSYSWRWSEARERDHESQLSFLHEMIVSLFNEAEVQGEIRPGNYHCGSDLIRAAYTFCLRKALYDQYDVDQLISTIEPHIALVLAGLSLPVPPGGVSHERCSASIPDTGQSS